MGLEKTAEEDLLKVSLRRLSCSQLKRVAVQGLGQRTLASLLLQEPSLEISCRELNPVLASKRKLVKRQITAKWLA